MSGASNTDSEPGGITVSGVSELVLEVGDLDRSEQFYAGVLGFPVVERWRDEAVWVMAGERTRIGLWLPQIGLGGGRGGVHVHYAMHIAEQRFDSAVERIRAAGREVYVHDHGHYGDGRGRAAYVTDPDGHCVELWTWSVAGHLVELTAGRSPGSH